MRHYIPTACEVPKPVANNGVMSNPEILPEILFEQRGAAGLITLNRPKALNALTLEMVTALKGQFEAWAVDPSIAAVVIRGAGERAFCAGADIRKARESGLSGTTYAREFFREEYLMNALIRHYPKPYVALIHGICMGGGLGVSVHGSHRICDPSVVFAMPETGIGLFPDVGGSYFLAQAPGATGLYLGLTGARADLADGLFAGFATHALSADAWPALIDALAEGQHPGTLLPAAASLPSQLAAERESIDRCFCGDRVTAVMAALQADNSEWAKKTAAILSKRSPTSLALSFAAIRAGKTLDFDACMKMEFRMVCRVLQGHDFYEGVRAVIVDKDNTPAWQPAVLSDVLDTEIAAYFAPLADELPLAAANTES